MALNKYDRIIDSVGWEQKGEEEKKAASTQKKRKETTELFQGQHLNLEFQLHVVTVIKKTVKNRFEYISKVFLMQQWERGNLS